MSMAQTPATDNGEQKKENRNKAGNTVGIFMETAGILILILAILIGIPLTVPRALGYQIYAAIDFNYGPQVAEGSVIYVEQYVGADLVPDDMVVYYSAAGTGVSLRLVLENHAEDKLLDVTDGWGNGETVSYAQVMGRAVLIVPVLGRILSFVASTVGVVILALLLVVAVALSLGGSHLRRHATECV